MDTFERALSFVLRWEGGYRLHRNPTETHYTYAGIYQKAYPRWEGWKYIFSGEEEKAKELVKEFYRLNFWKRLKCDHMPPKVAVAVFDTGVNLGVRRSARGLQKTLGVVADGIIGPKTIAAVNRANEEELVREFLKRRVIYYSKLSCEKFNIYKRGWVSRVFDLMKFLEG